MHLNVWAMCLISFSLTAIMVSRGRFLAETLNLMDVPGGRKKHLRPTPLMGGLAIIFVITPLMIMYSLIYPYYFQSAVFVITGVGFAITVLAIVDDRVHIPPVVRLLVSGFLFGAAMWWIPSLQIGSISWNGGSGYISLGRFTIVLTVLCLIALINAVNMADGKNGLVTGLSFGFSVILLVSARSNLSPVVAILVGATFALFLFNLRGRIFLGDGGSYGLAALIGLFSIFIYQRSDILISADQIGLMFMILVGDMGRLMITRMRMGKSPFEPDRNHLHHLLQDWIGWRQGLLLYWSMIFLPTILAIAFPQLTWVLIIFSIIMYLIVFSLCEQSRTRGIQPSSGN